MGGYFKPLRRKIGVATLLLTCVLAAVWVRSLVTADEIDIGKGGGNSSHFISSLSQLAWKNVTIRGDTLNIGFYTSKRAEEGDFYWKNKVEWKWRWQCCGFEFGRFFVFDDWWYEDIWIFPYWSMVIPVTLLSAWLLLSKPRVAKPDAIAEHSPAVGA